MAHYLGQSFNKSAFWLGMLTVLTLQEGTFLLVEYFRLPLTPIGKDEIPRQRESIRNNVFIIAAAMLALSSVSTIILLFARLLSIPAAVLLVLVFLLLYTYAIPPLRLSETGFGEVVQAFFLANLIPTIAFLLQKSEYHRLITMMTFPLTLIALGFLLILDFPTYATDQKRTHLTLLTRLTWQRAIPIHHILLLMAFMLFAVAPLFGFPWNLVWPVFLTLPFASLQIYLLQRIANGYPAIWNFLTTIASGTFGLTAYLLTLTFWIH